MPANICVPLFKGGEKDITVRATAAAVVGKTFAKLSDAFESGPVITTAVLPATYDGGNVPAITCPAGERCSGVFAYDAAITTVVPMIRAGKGHAIVPVTAGATITAPAEVEVGANGKAITLASGIAVGRATTDGVLNGDVFVELY